MLDLRFSEEDPILQHAKIILSNRLGNLSQIVIQLLKDQCRENECKTVVELINAHSGARVFFQPGKDTILHDALKHPELTKLLDAYFSNIKKTCKTADSIYEQVTSVVMAFFTPIKNTENWKSFWKKQAHKARLEDASWHENMIAGGFLFVIISVWENFLVQLSGLEALRETSPLMSVVKLVLRNPSKDSFAYALKKELQNTIRSLVFKGMETYKLHESISSVRETFCFQLYPDNEKLLIGEMLQFIKPFQQIIKDSPMLQLLQLVPEPLPAPIAVAVPVHRTKVIPPPLQLAAIAPEKHRSSTSLEQDKRSTSPPWRETSTNPTSEKKSTPRRGSGRGRSTSPRPQSKDLIDSTGRKEVPAIHHQPPTMAYRNLNFFPVPALPPDNNTTQPNPPTPQ